MVLQTPRVSIGLPVYNGENFLREACDAILAQTFTDFELIISDNGSTDATEMIGRAYAARDERVRYHRGDRNRGGAWNYNRVFALASGQYFMWHAHDDMIKPQFIECCVEVLDRHPEVINCYANSRIIDEHGTHLRDYIEGAALSSPSAYERLRHYNRHDRYCPLCSIYFGLMRREMLGTIILFQPYVNAEMSLMSELALRGQFYEIPEHLFVHRDHPGISTRRFPTPKERIVWWSPTKAGRGGWDGWRMLFARVRSVTVVPMSPYDRIRCYLYTFELFGHLASGSIRAQAARLRPRSATPGEQAEPATSRRPTPFAVSSEPTSTPDAAI